MATFAYADEPKWMNYPVQRKWSAESGLHGDVLNHRVGQPKYYPDRYTTVHENCHFISSEIRNKYEAGTNAFYLGNDRAIVLKEPKATIAQAASFVNKVLEGSRFNLYLVRQRQFWNDMPLYLVDEHVAYLMESKAAMEDALVKEPTEATDILISPIEFSVYTVALARAVAEHDKEYFASNKQFRDLITWLVKESFAVYHQGQKYPVYKNAADPYQIMKSGKGGTGFRNFCEKSLGIDLKEIFK